MVEIGMEVTPLAGIDAGARGSVTVKVVPSPRVLEADISPSYDRTMA
jgi:hypothetical protein